MNDIFDKIIAKEIPAQFVYEDDVCVVVMDKFPVIQGQVLVIPKDCVDYFVNLDDETYTHLLGVAKRISKALDITYNTLRTCVLIEGFEVSHMHIKLYPTVRREFHIHGGKEVDEATLEIEAQKIRANLV
ncbi:MAG: HIT family protein [Candidatus Kaiserbacteria bacterium]|nr:HIT family protein [Candidatus Kaiserbacteria bacterium]